MDAKSAGGRVNNGGGGASSTSAKVVARYVAKKTGLMSSKAPRCIMVWGLISSMTTTRRSADLLSDSAMASETSRVSCSLLTIVECVAGLAPES